MRYKQIEPEINETKQRQKKNEWELIMYVSERRKGKEKKM